MVPPLGALVVPPLGAPRREQLSQPGRIRCIWCPSGRFLFAVAGRVAPELSFRNNFQYFLCAYFAPIPDSYFAFVLETVLETSCGSCFWAHASLCMAMSQLNRPLRNKNGFGRTPAGPRRLELLFWILPGRTFRIVVCQFSTEAIMSNKFKIGK